MHQTLKKNRKNIKIPNESEKKPQWILCHFSWMFLFGIIMCGAYSNKSGYETSWIRGHPKRHERTASEKLKIASRDGLWNIDFNQSDSKVCSFIITADSDPRRGKLSNDYYNIIFSPRSRNIKTNMLLDTFYGFYSCRSFSSSFDSGGSIINSLLR